MILESYRLIAPKKSLAKLDVAAPSSGKDPQKTRRVAGASRKLAKSRNRDRG